MIRWTRAGAVALLLAATVIGGTTDAGGAMASAEPAPGEGRTLATEPLPGQPEGIAVDPTDGSVWTGSNRPRSPGALWHHDANGALLETYELQGHSPTSEHGINGITLDGSGRVYALDYSGARAVRLDPSTGAQSVYATFANLPTCAPSRPGPCEPSPVDRPAWPNWATFDAVGNMYVSDLNQATIWKVPPGGGEARIWYQNADFASIYSVNGMQFDAAGRLTFVVTLSLAPDASTIFRGVLYSLGVAPDGSAVGLQRVAEMSQGDGLAIGSSGKIYVAVANPLVNDIEIVEPGVGVVGALSSNTRGLSVPLITPASVAFQGTSLLATNHSQYALSPAEWTIQELGVGETGLPLHYPAL